MLDRILTKRYIRHARFRTIAGKILLVTVAAVCFPHTGSGQPSPSPSQTFESYLEKRFKSADPNWTIESLCPTQASAAAARIFRSYGSVFVVEDPVTLPAACIYDGESAVLKFQKALRTRSVLVGGIWLTFQEPAADALQRAVNQADEMGLRITPLDGAIAGSRTYGDSLRLWNGRFFRALDYWTRVGRLTADERDAITRADLQRKVEMVLEWEGRGIFFSTDRTRSILSSTAPPGASQHLSMLAFDVVEYGRPEIREVMNRNGWFQTVVDDPPHFTYLGVPDIELPARGLLVVQKGTHRYWIPNMSTPIR